MASKEQIVRREGKAGLADEPNSERMFGKVDVSKSEHIRVCSAIDASSQIPHCTKCHSKKVWRNGLRLPMVGEPIQRWLCRDCGLRFSEQPLQKKLEQSLNMQGALSSVSQICVSETKNFGSATEIKTVAGDIKRTPPKLTVLKNLDIISKEARGLLIEFMAYIEHEGFDDENQYPNTLSNLAKCGANLLDPENVKSVIAKHKKLSGEPWSDSMKLLATCAYDTFCQMKGIQWIKPVYHQDEITIPLIDEKDLDMLISAAKKKLATFLSCLKETYADPTEILNCEWIDLKNNVLSINHPVKNHYPGKYTLSPRLVAMLNALPKKKKRIFATTYKTIYASLLNLRTKAAERLQNPALLQITFKSFRHWGGTKIAYESHGNMITIMRVLRHKSFKSSLRYIHAIEFKEDEDFDTTAATTPEEIMQLGQAGWQKYDEITINSVQIHFYRKPKRFGGQKKQDNKNEKRVDTFLCTA